MTNNYQKRSLLLTDFASYFAVFSTAIENQSVFFLSCSLISDFTITTAVRFKIGLNNTRVQVHEIWKWSSGWLFDE